MHFQRAPHAEAKLIRCTRGTILDVIVDLRRDSPTYRRWISCELSDENHRMLYIPEGLAHGFQTFDRSLGSSLPDVSRIPPRSGQWCSLGRSRDQHSVAFGNHQHFRTRPIMVGSGTRMNFRDHKMSTGHSQSDHTPGRFNYPGNDS